MHLALQLVCKSVQHQQQPYSTGYLLQCGLPIAVLNIVVCHACERLSGHTAVKLQQEALAV